MHERLDFERYKIREELSDLCEDWEYPVYGNGEEVLSLVEEIRVEITETEVFNPRYKLTSTIYYDDNGEIKSIKFTVALTKADEKLKIEKYRKKTFTVNVGIDFFDDFVFELSGFFDGYGHGLMLQENLDEFNKRIEDIIDRDSHETNNSRLKRMEGLIKSFESKDNDRLKGLYINRETIYSQIKIMNLLVDCIRAYDYINENRGYYTSETAEDISTIFVNTVFDNKVYEELSSYKSEISVPSLMDVFGEIAEEAIDIINDIEPNKDRLNISFGYGKGLLDISDNHAVIGLSEDVIKNLGSLPLFDELLEERVEGYTGIILESINKCEKSYDLINVTTIFTKDIGINEGTKIYNIIMKSFGKLQPYGEGVGYYMNEDIIALIKKKKATDSQIERGNYFTSSKDEQLNVRFKMKPFDINTNEQKELTIEDIWSEIQKNNE